MSLPEIYQHFISGLLNTSWLEYIAVLTGIASVWFARIEHIWTYPIGLISTIIYTWLSLVAHLPGEASVNVYYTVMSIYGWMLWGKKDIALQHVVAIQFSDKKEWLQQILFFLVCYIAIFSVLTLLKKIFSPEVIPWADALASATAFTGMWLMAKKKVESWYWWLLTDIASIPLYFVKHYVFTSVYYLVLLVLATFGLFEWMRRARLAASSKANN